MKALWDSIVRTLVPVIVGAVLTWVTTLGVELDPEFEGALTLVITAVFTAVYYIAVRLLETHVTPKLGWLLGSAKQPDYFKRVKVTEDGQTFQQRAEPVSVDDVLDVSSQDRYPLHGN
jgi:hypothetical protein